MLFCVAAESAAAALRRKVSGPSKEELAWAAAERSRLRQRIDLLEIEKLRLHHESEVRPHTKLSPAPC